MTRIGWTDDLGHDLGQQVIDEIDSIPAPCEALDAGDKECPATALWRVQGLARIAAVTDTRVVGMCDRHKANIEAHFQHCIGHSIAFDLVVVPA